MAHIHEKIDYTADVFVVHQGKVLLRMHEKYGVWLTPGGHIELDEDPVQAALREVKEETGLEVTLWEGNKSPVNDDARVKILVPPVCMNRQRINDTHEHVSMVYFATTTTDEIKPQAGEVQDACKWFTKEELDTTDIPENIREYATFALDTLAKE
jgi:ADP-ribose pyrophosphatase YjhB (NUDIX family)